MFLTKILRAADHPYLSGKGGRKVQTLLSKSSISPDFKLTM